MSFDSRVNSEERTQFADLVLNGEKTVREISDQHQISRKTVQNWVERRRAELGVPTPPRGGGPTLPTRALVRIEKAEKARAEAEERAAMLEARVAELEAQVVRQGAAITHLKGTLRIYMEPELAGVLAAV
ncbi:helix-turn-helix domain-containing protein [Streptomyces sp. NPDC058256]|uniref:helix-turn-helix domain-containing protein n=1 Tax=Streptomyces sp. NPDC058256 TaxID=3346408 RepID=UPI0036E12A2C